MTGIGTQIKNALSWFKNNLVNNWLIKSCVADPSDQSTVENKALSAWQGKLLQDQINSLNTNCFAVVNEEISITPATAKQITWKTITLPKGTYIITLFLQLKSDSPARNYLSMYANNADFSGTLPLADIYNGTVNFSNTSVNIIRVSKSCTIDCAYLTPVSCAVAYHIYRVKQ